MEKCKTCLPLFLLITAVIMLPGPSVRAAAVDRIQKEIQYETADREEKRTAEFPEKMEENGTTYRRGEIAYQILEEEPVTETKTVFLTKKSGKLKPDEAYSPAQDITEDEVAYGLLDTRKKVETVKKGYTQTVTGYSLYASRAAAETAASTKKIQAVDPQTKKKVTVSCMKQGIVRKMADTWEDTYIDIEFVAYDASHFSWNGIVVEKNEKEPLKGYEKELLESVGGKKADYRIKDIRWRGKSYKNSDGVLCRRARADVRRKVSRYRVDYKGTRTVKAERRVVYISTYTGEKEAGTGEVRYTIQAQASYEAEKTGLPAAVLTVGILFCLLVAAGILSLLVWKKKSGRKQED